MKKLLIIIFIFIGFNLLLADNQSEYIKANDFYKTGQYTKAIETYKSIIETGNVSANLYYNLGNSYFKLNKIADAIINYERAKKLAPNDADIDFNLKIANLRIVDKIEQTPKFFLNEWIDNVLGLFTSSGWGWITILLIWLGVACFLAVLYVVKGQSRKIVFVVSLLCIFASVFFWYLAQTKYSEERNSNYGIIFNESVYVKASPDEKSTDLFILHEGTKLEIVNSLNDWIQVKLQNGNVGWIGINEIVKI